jgi:predicted nucleic acid-binding Zn ribbon protein
MPNVMCPSCGIAVRSDTVYCPFCRGLVSKPNIRRLMLWTTVVAEYLSIAVLSVHR